MKEENAQPAPMPPERAGQLVLYRTEDGRTRISCRVGDDSVWLTQAAIADLFETTPQNITLHIGAIYQEGELSEDATCKEYLQVRPEGSRQVSRRLKHYNLKVVLAVGYRVRSPRGTQFRQWATGQLEQYLVKGFAMDDERLKQAGGGNYFDELLPASAISVPQSACSGERSSTSTPRAWTTTRAQRPRRSSSQIPRAARPVPEKLTEYNKYRGRYYRSDSRLLQRAVPSRLLRAVQAAPNRPQAQRRRQPPNTRSSGRGLSVAGALLCQPTAYGLPS